ncbi:MAG: homoaconitase [Bacteroidetes bacterium]|nr:homoaconitase [Bacteroidota bacterium]
MSQNMIEKIAQKFAVGLEEGQKVHAGDFISIKPAHIMTHDNTGAVIPKFRSIGAVKLANPRQVVHTLDHNIQDTSEKNLEKYKKIEEFSNSMGADFYPAGRGIGHQIMCEEGYAWSGTMVVASDSHSNMYGGLGCLGTPIVRTDAAAIWATGRTWWQIPPVAKVILKGRLKNGVTGKDVIIALCGKFNNDEVLNHVIEFVGDGVENLTVDQRLSIANMTTEWGALAGVFPIDGVTFDWLKKRNSEIEKRGLAGVPSDSDGNGKHPRINSETIELLRKVLPELEPDADAFYSKELSLELNSVIPYVSGPNTVKVMSSVAEIKKQKVKIHKAYLVSCVNSRLEDFAESAKVLIGKKIADGVQFYVSAASNEVQAESEKLGYWKILLDSGATTLPPGCGPCIGLGAGLLEDNEVGISATNRNFKGRMGSPSAKAYLASPAVVAASAISGYIDYDLAEESHEIIGNIKSNKKSTTGVSAVKIIDGFPASVEGEVVFCNQDNLNTDGIYPGKYTYIDDFKPEDQAKVVMENYDPEFSSKISDGSILVGGYTFGTGSSREQAATAFKYRGITCLIAGSFSDTYLRNAFNNGFLCLQSTEFVDLLKEKYGKSQLTLLTGIKATINFKNSLLSFDGQDFSIGPVGKAAQELIVDGGLENWVVKNLAKK